jgi:hypothetical protein
MYDDSPTTLTSRVYFILKLYGFNMEQIKILDGGTLPCPPVQLGGKTACCSPGSGCRD